MLILTIVSAISIYMNIDSYRELKQAKSDLFDANWENDRLCEKINVILGYNHKLDPNNYEENRQRLKDAGIDYGPEGKNVLK